MGDVKLMGLLGGLLGWQGVLLSLFLACLAGALIGGAMLFGSMLARWIRGATDDVDHYMPFGPYLAFSAIAVLLFRPELFDLLQRIVFRR